MTLFFLKNQCYILLFFALACTCQLNAKEKLQNPPFVVGEISSQLGNNLFQIATTCAFAWDNKAEPLFPDLLTPKNQEMIDNIEHVFFRCNIQEPHSKISKFWQLPYALNFCYTPIPYTPNMSISGAFQSEKFFAHRRNQILALFAPKKEDSEYIKSKYGHILEHPCTVGVQVRWFGVKGDRPWWSVLVQYGYDFFEQAMAQFPEGTLFVVSSNHIEFARKNIPDWPKNVIFLEGEPHYIDFFLLSLCKHQIISNSSFGWWAAWLNKNSQKIVIVPELWIDPEWEASTPVQDVWPETWIKLKATWEKPSHKITAIK